MQGFRSGLGFVFIAGNLLVHVDYLQLELATVACRFRQLEKRISTFF